MFRCQERNSDRDWGITAGNIPFHGILLSLVQESINVPRKCSVQVSVPVVENNSDGYPENIQLFRVEIHAIKSLGSCLSVSTHCRPGFVQG